MSPTGLKANEIKSMLGEGVRATINSDDPAYFPGYVNAVSWLEQDDRDEYLDALGEYAATHV